MLQVQWISALGLAVVTSISSLALAAQTGDPLAAIQQKLNSQFKLTTTTANLSDIVSAGDVVALQKNGLKMSALSALATESNTYKDGKIGGGTGKRIGSWIGTAMLEGVAAGLDPSGSAPADIPAHTAAAGERCWVLAAAAQKDGVLFKLYTDPDANGIRYRANLKILFPNKKEVPPADAVSRLVAEVLTVVQAQDDSAQAAGTAPGDPSGVTQPDSQAGPSGEYTAKNGSRLLLLPDNTFTKSVGSLQSHGTYLVSEGLLPLYFDKGGPNEVFRIQGGDLVDITTSDQWLRVGGHPALTPEAVAESSPAPPKYQAVAPPPPPPPPAPSVAMGQTKDQVTAAFGEPQRKAAAGAKEIFFYTDLKMKVTFTGGKVSGID